MEISYKNFRSKVLDNLFDYCKRKYGNDKLGGIYRGKAYNHILKIEGFNKLDVVKDYNLLCGAKAEPFLIVDKLHSNAHHLNSSQIMCYNFFRPLINKDSSPKEELIAILRGYCSNLDSKGAHCIFEYEEEYGDGTNFDFYIENGDISVFCEIKYTEDYFKKNSNCKNSKERYEKVYKPMIDGAWDLWKDNVSEDAVMNKYYQLFRNALKAKKGKSYVLFICPRDNCGLKKQYDDFRRIFMKENDVVQYVFWEDLVDVASKIGVDMCEFKKKYFGYKQ